MKIRNLHISLVAALLAAVFPLLLKAQGKEGYQSIDRALALYQQERYPEAAKLFTKTMEEAERRGDKRMAVVCTGYIGNIYANYGDYHRNLYYLLKGYKDVVKMGDKPLEARFTSNIVNAYCHLGNVGEAKRYFQKQQELDLKPTDKDWKYYTMYNKARIARLEKHFDEAISIHQATLELARKEHLGKMFELFQLSEIGNIYMEQKRYDEARRMGRRCLAMANGLHSRELIANAAQMLAESYSHLGIADSAAQFRKLYETTADTVYNIPNLNQATTQLFEYENKQSSDKIENLNNTVNKQWWIIAVIAVLLVITASLALLLMRYNRKLRATQKLLIDRSKELQQEERRHLPKPLRTEGKLADQHDILLSRITKALDDIEIISNPDLTLTKLAEIVNSNTTYVSSIINEAYGKNFKTLLNERRISEAAQRLTDKNYQNQTIQAVYESVGYRNTVSFLRAFKKIYGMTPSEYQKAERE